MFPEWSVRVSTEGENENIRHIFDLRLLVIEKWGMVAKKLLVDDKITACVRHMSPGCH